jgi:hypothetical protein
MHLMLSVAAKTFVKTRCQHVLSARPQKFKTRMSSLFPSVKHWHTYGLDSNLLFLFTYIIGTVIMIVFSTPILLLYFFQTFFGNSDADAFSSDWVYFSCFNALYSLANTLLYSADCAFLQEQLFVSCCAPPELTLASTSSPASTKSPVATVPLFLPTSIPTDQPKQRSTASPSQPQQRSTATSLGEEDNISEMRTNTIILFVVIGVLGGAVIGLVGVQMRQLQQQQQQTPYISSDTPSTKEPSQSENTNSLPLPTAPRYYQPEVSDPDPVHNSAPLNSKSKPEDLTLPYVPVTPNSSEPLVHCEPVAW